MKKGSSLDSPLGILSKLPPQAKVESALERSKLSYINRVETYVGDVFVWFHPGIGIVEGRDDRGCVGTIPFNIGPSWHVDSHSMSWRWRYCMTELSGNLGRHLANQGIEGGCLVQGIAVCSVS
jgi:hypothetical protein